MEIISLNYQPYLVNFNNICQQIDHSCSTNSCECVSLLSSNLLIAVQLITNIMKQQSPIQCRQEQYQNGKIPLFTITPSITKVLSWVTTAGHTKFLLSVQGIIRPTKERMKGMMALLTLVLGMVNLLDGLWKLKRLSAIPQAKKERLQKQQYLQKRLELLTNSASLQSRSNISLMKQKAGTLAKMNRTENARGVVFAKVYFITAIFSFIISDTCFAGYFQVLKQRFN